ncbi:MAG: hypothetical protein HYX59_12905, partial [Elusimicrobia bacterium]|nr:hypothetical protein [Elusimicrobiota bacterium]
MANCLKVQSDFVSACKKDIQDSTRSIERLEKQESLTPDQKTELAKARTLLRKSLDGMEAAKALAEQVSEDPDRAELLPHFVTLQNESRGITALVDGAMASLKAPAEEAVLQSVADVLNGASKAPPQKTGEIIAQAGDQALANGRTDDAEKLGEELVKSAPADYRGPSLLAQAALTENRPADAARWAEKALLLNPRDKKASDALAFARSELSAQKLKKPVVGSFQEARAQELERSLAAATIRPAPGGPTAAPDPKAAAKSADPVQRVLSGLLRRGYEKMRLDDLPGALGDVSVHLDSHPEDAEARL